ncbi:MAG: TfoX/Sxy family protein [Chloroflexi bacterium]|nr:TfoX/Sxy family protein [Chloroflexota bacterium]
MAYDETLAARIRASLAHHSGLSERKMFGGLAFMLSGNMCCCVTEHGLMVRVGPDAYEDALSQPHAGLMDLTGRPMKGWVLVQLEGLASDAALSQWVQRGAEFAATLPPK